jgi:tRNA G26 N,N-dimethylase Trm1
MLCLQPSVGDARIVMMQAAGEYDAVDLDPYGSPAMLLDSAVQVGRGVGVGELMGGGMGKGEGGRK